MVWVQGGFLTMPDPASFLGLRCWMTTLWDLSSSCFHVSLLLDIVSNGQSQHLLPQSSEFLFRAQEWPGPLGSQPQMLRTWLSFLCVFFFFLIRELFLQPNTAHIFLPVCFWSWAPHVFLISPQLPTLIREHNWLTASFLASTPLALPALVSRLFPERMTRGYEGWLRAQVISGMDLGGQERMMPPPEPQKLHKRRRLTLEKALPNCSEAGKAQNRMWWEH